MNLYKRHIAKFLRLCLIIPSYLYAASTLADTKPANEQHTNGQNNFNTFCASCHLGAMPEAPILEALKLYPPERIVTALESGVMSTQGLPLSRKEKHNLTFYLTGKKIVKKKIQTNFACANPNNTQLNLNKSATWNGFGGQDSSIRYQEGEQHLTPENINKLKLKWSFAFPDTTRVRAQPIVTPQITYIASQAGIIMP